MRHYRKTLKAYAELNAGDNRLKSCTFCHEYGKNKPNIIAENGTMFIIPNRVSYDMFEG